MPTRSSRIFSRFHAVIAVADAKTGAMLVSVFSAIVLAGCAAEFAYGDAQYLVANDQVEAGLAKYQEALKLDPNNAEYRAAYAQTRERTANVFLEQADRLLEAGQRGEAEQIYRRVLALDPRNDRARAGIGVLVRDQRHAEQLKEAAAELERKNIESARAKLSSVLGENPHNEEARSMLNSIEVKAEAPALESLLAEVYKKPISIEFKDAQLKQVFEAISHSSGLNILFDKDVKVDQKTSIFLKNSTIEAAIYYMLLTNQLEQQVMDANTLLIYPANSGKQKDYQQLVVKTFHLANAKAKAIAETLKTIMKIQNVVVDENLNMLIVRDSPEAIRLAEKLVAMQDVPEPEVMLEVEILEISRERLMELGISYPGSLTLTPLSAAGGTALTVADLRHVNQKTMGAAIDPIKLNARKVDTDADILANPRIRVLNHEKAKIMIGNRVPSITTSIVATGAISESVSYMDVGLKLEVEPTIYLDNDVAIRIALEVSNIIDTQKSASGTVTYTIGTRNANTMLRLKDGENQVLAGLINDEDRRSANKLPGLGDIPIAGRLFGSTLNDGTKSEIVLSITPHLIRNIKRPEASAAEFPSGTESSLRRRPDLSARPASVTLAAGATAPEAGKPPAAEPGPIAGPVPVPTPAPQALPAAGEEKAE